MSLSPSQSDAIPALLALAACLLTVGPGGQSSCRADPPAPKTKVNFARDIRPILANHCWSCHGPDEHNRQAGLRLDRADAATGMLKNGHRAIVPGSVKDSALAGRIDSVKESRRMPPPDSKKPLNKKQKELLKRWIEQGAEYSPHWAFIAPKRPDLRSLKANKTWPRNPIDYFILHRLEQEGLTPSPEAGWETLLRRASLDLTGLPPTPEEIARFLSDKGADAYEKAIVRLLASPRFGERMAMQWLDLARYADTNGYNNDEIRTMWPWRDWVINAYNRNLPFDRFVIEQIAGDMLPHATLDQKIATGFNRNHVLTTEGGIIEEEYRVEYVADRVHTTSSVFLGLSLGCARCHDHKYDPITQKEYYQFFAFFNNLPDGIVPHSNTPLAPEPAVKIVSPQDQKKLRELEGRRAELRKRLKGKEAPEAKAELALVERQIKDVEKNTVSCMVMADMAKPRDTFLLKRGQYNQRGDKVTPGVPAALQLKAPLPQPGNRLGLARWLVDPKNPLLARVAVNRMWALHFGSGLVETLEDFGVQGDLPSHPELLDWLATEFIRTGWDVKAMHRLIVTSATYRQSARATPLLLERDPKNRLLARSPRFRLGAETVRDNALAISGLLVERLGGPSVKPYQPAGLWEDVSVDRRYKYQADKGEGLYRRSMYTFWRRTIPPPAMLTLDAPDREICVIRRARTNTPLQALILLNDPTYVEAARKLAEIMLKTGTTPEEHLNLAYLRALARQPKETERRILLGLYKESLERFRADRKAAVRLLSVGESPRDGKLDSAEHAAWTVVASTILNLDETISRP